jgi:hypothetical protein
LRPEPEESAEEFLHRMFEFETCDECGGAADDHDVVRLDLGAYGDGGWRTICRNPPDGVHCPHCGTPYDGDKPCRACEEDVRERSRTEPPPNWRDFSDEEDPATGWTQLEVAESKWAARTGKCCYVIADAGWDGPRKLCGERVALGWIYCADHLKDISCGDPRTVDPERFRVGQF